MSSAVFVGLLGGVCGLFVLLAWVGWRYFVAPLPRVEVYAVPMRASVNLKRHPSVLSGLRRSKNVVLWAAIPVAVGGAAVGGVFSISGWIAPDPLSLQEWDRQAHIQSALNPEHLVPPPLLPPSLFIGSGRPGLETANRDWEKLNPHFADAVLHLLARLQSRGYTFVLLEGFRSPERQEELADLGTHVTSARAFQSKHQFGLAADLAPLRDGRLVVTERDPWAMQAYLVLGEETEKSGLTWGGRWWFKDYGHVETIERPGATARPVPR